MLPCQADELVAIEAGMANFEGMTQHAALQLVRQQREEFSDFLRIEMFGGSELPIDRPEFGAELQHSAPQEAFDARGTLGKSPAIGHEPRRLHAEHESV